MMRPAPTLLFVSNHRLARLTAWARLWLAWFTGVFAARSSPVYGGGGREAAGGGRRRQLDQAARMLAQLIFLHVAARVRLPPTHTLRHGRHKQSGLTRACIGAALRAALKGKDTPARLAALLTTLRDIELHIAKLARRLARGLTRRRVIVPAPGRGPLFAAAPRPPAALADTS